MLEEGPIDELKHVKDVKQEPGSLPAGFEWCIMDIKRDDQVSQVRLENEASEMLILCLVSRGSSAVDGELCRR